MYNNTEWPQEIIWFIWFIPAAYNSKSVFQLGLRHMYMNDLILPNEYKCLSHRFKDVKLLLNIIQYFSDLEATTDLLLCNTELYAVFITQTLKSSKLIL